MKSESGGLSTEGQLLRMPFCILNNNKFYSSDYFEPRKFNKWFRKNGFSRPFHGKKSWKSYPPPPIFLKKLA